MNRFLTLLLSLIFLLGGCQNGGGDTTTPPPQTTTKPTVTQTESATTVESEVPDQSESDSETDVEAGHKHESDPYENVDKEEFYADYEPACCYADSRYRTKHYLMSGDISDQDQAPSVAEDRPTDDGKYVRNTTCVYEDNGKTYCILDSDGDIVNRIYKGGAYVVLEEVAAYVLAFGEIPANYSQNKKTRPLESPWGEYLRVNHTKFSGSTTKYPYEPELPNISGCGGDLTYYEMDIGTTGTDCDPSYTAKIYNDGVTITRGAARIVYTVYDKNGNSIIDPNEKYVFYTYNHYNDFQEYLNYEGGWGEMFGNITGGGTISSKSDYNPTPYVPTAREDFPAA